MVLKISSEELEELDAKTLSSLVADSSLRINIINLELEEINSRTIQGLLE